MALNFSVGASVVVKKPFSANLDEFGLSWTPSMDQFDNSVRTITGISNKGDGYKLSGCSNHTFKEDWLVLNGKAPELKPLSKYKKGDTLIVKGPRSSEDGYWTPEHARYLNIGLVVKEVEFHEHTEPGYSFNGCDIGFLESWLTDDLKTTGVGANAPKSDGETLAGINKKLDAAIEDVNKNNSQYTDKADRSNLDPRGVNHPPHYNAHPSGIECIEVVRHMTFNLGSAVKYVWRIGLKPVHDAVTPEDDLKDLEKAIWYIKDEIQRCKAVNDKHKQKE